MPNIRYWEICSLHSGFEVDSASTCSILGQVDYRTILLSSLPTTFGTLFAAINLDCCEDVQIRLGFIRRTIPDPTNCLTSSTWEEAMGLSSSSGQVAGKAMYPLAVGVRVSVWWRWCIGMRIKVKKN